MINIIKVVVFTLILGVLVSGCSTDADIASRNLSKAA